MIDETKQDRGVSFEFRCKELRMRIVCELFDSGRFDEGSKGRGRESAIYDGAAGS